MVYEEIAVWLDPMPQDGLLLVAIKLEAWGQNFLKSLAGDSKRDKNV